MANGGWRPPIESALCLSLLRLMQLRLVQPGCNSSGSLHWNRSGEPFASVAYAAGLGERDGTLTLNYKADGESAQDVIRLSSIPNHFGGKNWFMHCPATGKRARKLYKWSGLPHFRHREAVRPRPTYASQRDSGSDRIIRQRWALRHKLGDDFSDLFSSPCKPKRMRWHTFGKYEERDAALAAREDTYLFRFLGRMGFTSWNDV